MAGLGVRAWRWACRFPAGSPVRRAVRWWRRRWARASGAAIVACRWVRARDVVRAAWHSGLLLAATLLGLFHLARWLGVV